MQLFLTYIYTSIHLRASKTLMDTPYSLHTIVSNKVISHGEEPI